MTNHTKQGRKPRAGAESQKLIRSASVRSQTFDEAEKTVDLVWTTGAAVRRYDFWDGDEFEEVLSLESGAVRLDRLNKGAPFLNTHSNYDLSDVIGSVVPGSARIDGGLGVATVKLSGAAADADTIGKIRDGIIRNISVGYLVHAFTESEQGGVKTRTATDWEPLEISAVPIPADPGAQIRSHGGTPARARRPVSRRVSDIRRMARKAGLPKFGEAHVRAGTTEDGFFRLLAERLSPSKERQMTKQEKHLRGFKAGQSEAERLLGRSRRDDDAPADDDDEDGDEHEFCPTCGQPIADRDDQDDKDDDDPEDRDDDLDDDEDRQRSARLTGRRVRAAPGHSPSGASRVDQPRPTHARMDRTGFERGAAEARKALGKR